MKDPRLMRKPGTRRSKGCRCEVRQNYLSSGDKTVSAVFALERCGRILGFRSITGGQGSRHVRLAA